MSKCSENEFRCNSSGRCIPWAWVCDKEIDCHDGADESIEQECIPFLTDACTPDKFMCLNKKCIRAVSCSELEKKYHTGSEKLIH